MIANAHRTVMETEDVANDITQELARNREKIESSRAKVCSCKRSNRSSIETFLEFAYRLENLLRSQIQREEC